MNLQDAYLNTLRKEKIPSIFLVRGTRLQGVITFFDQFTLLLEDGKGGQQLVYKHSVATIVPARPVRPIFPPKDEGSSANG